MSCQFKAKREWRIPVGTTKWNQHRGEIQTSFSKLPQKRQHFLEFGSISDWEQLSGKHPRSWSICIPKTAFTIKHHLTHLAFRRGTAHGVENPSGIWYAACRRFHVARPHSAITPGDLECVSWRWERIGKVLSESTQSWVFYFEEYHNQESELKTRLQLLRYSSGPAYVIRSICLLHFPSQSPRLNRIVTLDRNVSRECLQVVGKMKTSVWRRKEEIIKVVTQRKPIHLKTTQKRSITGFWISFAPRITRI